MNAAGRRVELIRILRIRRKDTVQNLARELGVNERTIRRDLLILTVDEGYLIDTIQGNGGCVVYNGKPNPYKGILSQEQIEVLNSLKKYADDHQITVIIGMLEAFS
ncbi:MAG: HTH domain-containing protein [Defluviitaleaceae bacterium]|nr:HTH domain-containing protein [Defluviitaleaceae bacterium]